MYGPGNMTLRMRWTEVYFDPYHKIINNEVIYRKILKFTLEYMPKFTLEYMPKFTLEYMPKFTLAYCLSSLLLTGKSGTP